MSVVIFGPFEIQHLCHKLILKLRNLAVFAGSGLYLAVPSDIFKPFHIGNLEVLEKMSNRIPEISLKNKVVVCH